MQDAHYWAWGSIGQARGAFQTCKPFLQTHSKGTALFIQTEDLDYGRGHVTRSQCFFVLVFCLSIWVQYCYAKNERGVIYETLLIKSKEWYIFTTGSSSPQECNGYWVTQQLSSLQFTRYVVWIKNL